VKYYLLSANTTFVSFKKGNIITEKKTLLTLYIAFDPDGFLSYPAGLKTRGSGEPVSLT